MGIRVFILLLALIWLTGCRSDQVKQDPEFSYPADAVHNSRNSLDWSGVYRGVLPCADCEGIQMEIRLKENLTYKMTTHYLGKSEQVFRNSGPFEWNAEGSRIMLKDMKESAGHRLFQVGENRLFMLDRDGNRIQGDLATWYILEKVKEQAE